MNLKPLSFHVLERGNENRLIWTYPSINDQLKFTILKTCFSTSLEAVNLFYYQHVENYWIYIYQFVENGTKLAIIIISQYYHPKLYRTLCDMFFQKYTATKSGADLVQLFLKIYVKNGISLKENSSADFIQLKDFPQHSNLKGKIKIMFSTVEECANPILKILNNEDNIKDGVDIKELMLRYAKDVIGAAAFGVDCNTLEDPNSSFNKHTNGFFKVNFLRLVNIGMGLLLSRDILQKIGYRFTPKYIEDFFLNLVKQTIEHRENNNIMRKDFLQILMELKNNKQNLLGESKEDEDTDFGINNIAANVFLFFVAGVETTANTTSFALMELAINQDIQDKVRSEIHTVLNKYNGKLSYEAVNEMEYLEQVILETLRKHPTAQKMHRQCIKPYKVPGTDIMLEAGTRVVVPVWSIHMDPEYYPNPEKFDPDRFSLQNKAKLDSGCFLGFGDGPRYCIGVRMGKLQTKIAIIKIIQNFRVTLNEKLKQPIQYGFSIVGAAIKGGIWLDVEKI